MWETDSRFASRSAADFRLKSLAELAPNYAARITRKYGRLPFVVEMRKVRYG